MSTAQRTRITEGYKEPSYDYFTDVRRGAAAWLYQNDPEYRRTVNRECTRATNQHAKKKERA